MGEVSNGGRPQLRQNQPPAPGGQGSRGTARAHGQGNAASTGSVFVPGIAPQSRALQSVVGLFQTVLDAAGTVQVVVPRQGGGTTGSGGHPTGPMLGLPRRTLGSTGPTT